MFIWTPPLEERWHVGSFVGIVIELIGCLSIVVADVVL